MQKIYSTTVYGRNNESCCKPCSDRCMFFTAFIIKKIGKRNMLIVGSCYLGLCFAMFGFVGTNMTGIMIACVLKGVGNAGISSCDVRNRI